MMFRCRRRLYVKTLLGMYYLENPTTRSAVTHLRFLFSHEGATPYYVRAEGFSARAANKLHDAVPADFKGWSS